MLEWPLQTEASTHQQVSLRPQGGLRYNLRNNKEENQFDTFDPRADTNSEANTRVKVGAENGSSRDKSFSQGASVGGPRRQHQNSNFGFESFKTLV